MDYIKLGELVMLAHINQLWDFITLISFPHHVCKHYYASYLCCSETIRESLFALHISLDH